MSPKVDKDPELVRQQQQANAEKVASIQERLSTQTDQSLRYFGARRAMSGSSGKSSVASLAGM